MSAENLAARLDALDAGDAFVTEGESSIIVSGLGVEVAREIVGLCATLGWVAHIEDNAGTVWQSTALDADYAPFRVSFDKPAPAPGVLRLLTKTGFAAWLARDDVRSHWQVIGLQAPLRCYAVTFSPWSDEPAQPRADEVLREARRLVRETAGQRTVPACLSRWLIADLAAFPPDSAILAVWARCAARKLILTLPDEVDSEAQRLRFKGPPRLDLDLPTADADLAALLGREGFLGLQAALDWVFEIEREAEMRHILLAAEIARSGGTGTAADKFIKDNIADALASAKLAYQLQLVGMSSDALKTLSELRKTVSDDTAKVAEGTRQIITAVAGALAIGAGLIAARLSGSVDPALVTIVMILAVTYVAITILSGISFTLLQRSVRKAWQPRLYRFLAPADYASLVRDPAKKAEYALWVASLLGTVAAALMALAISRVEPPPAVNKETVPPPAASTNPQTAPQALPPPQPTGAQSNRMVGQTVPGETGTTASATQKMR